MDLPTPDDLRERRNELELTQSELAERADVSQPLIARIEGGDVDPRLSTLRRIVNALEEAEGGIVRARDVMNSPVASVEPDDSVHQSRELMEERGYSQVAVIRDGVPQGIIGHSDILQESGEDVGNLPVNEVMNNSYVSVEPDTPISNVKADLKHNPAVFVVKNQQVEGIITEADIARTVS